MDTIGDRIRKARLARKWSAAELAKRAGYKTQSGISNLENRNTGSGGHKITHLAKVLQVPLDWLLNGGDGDKVPLNPLQEASQQVAQTVQEVTAVYQFKISEDAKTLKLLSLWAQLDDVSKSELLGRIEFYVAGRGPHQDGQALSVAGN